MANGIDDHLGQRLRQRRWMLGLTQTQVGDRVGIKFQQIQKYETGQNRISAARLWDLSLALDVPVSYFYDGLSVNAEAEAALDAVAPEAGSTDPLAERETIELARAYLSLPAPSRAKLLDFLKALAIDTQQDAVLRRQRPTSGDERTLSRARPEPRRHAV